MSDNIFLTHAQTDNSVTKEDLYRYFYLAIKENINDIYYSDTITLKVLGELIEDLEEALKYIDGK